MGGSLHRPALDRYASRARSKKRGCRVQTFIRSPIVIACAVIACGACWTSGWAAGDPSVSPKEAAALFEGGNFENALPVYEALAASDPTSALYAERLAFCLLVKFESLPDGAERTATFERVRTEAERAEALGDDSNLLHVILDRLEQPIGKAQGATMQAAEAAFSRGDFATALAGYQDIALRDPRSYEARLYAGDVYFVMKKLEPAAEWFQKAIDVDPDRETAYRYWGDALLQFNQQDAARQKFIEAVVAEPYSRRPWLGLKQWADQTGHELGHPRVEVPVQPEHTKSERHSLADEVAALETLLASGDGSKQPAGLDDESLRNLRVLQQDGMLAPYVLISAADEGIAQDYAAYRAAHRDVLRAYVDKHVIHRK